MSHSPLSPSGAHRWLRCPGSVEASARYPDRTSTYAEEGTAAHALAAKCLLAKQPASAHEGTVVHTSPDGTAWVVTPEMARDVQKYLDWVADLASQSEDWDMLVEQRVDLSRWLGEDEAGTSDLIGLAYDLGRIYVLDLKFGRGEVVYADDNEQLRAYALGALDSVSLLADFKEVVMGIGQPRLNHFDVTEPMPVEQLLDWGANHLAPGAYAAKTPDAPRIPGPVQCRWCKAAGGCAEAARVARESIPACTDFDTFVEAAPLDPLALSGDEIARILGARPFIEQFLASVVDEAGRRMEEAQDAIPGWKRVQGRPGHRKWKNPEEVEEYVKKRRLVRVTRVLSLASPTQMERLHEAGDLSPAEWAALQEMITWSDGSPAVVPVSDKRPALPSQSRLSDFDHFGDSET